MSALEVSTSSKPAEVSDDGGRDVRAFSRALKALLRKAFSFPVLMGALLAGGVFGSAYTRLQPQTHAPARSAITPVIPVIAVFEGDTWYHILVGEDILKNHRFPNTDSYTFTAYGNEHMAFEWLGQILMALTARLGGLRALAALACVSTAVLLLLLYYYTTLRCGNSKAAFVTSVPMMLAIMFFFTLRPQLFGYIFLFLTMILLEHFRRGRTWALWLLPPLFVIWANTHGSFVLGLLVLGFCWAAGLVRFQVGGLQAESWSPRQRLHLEVVMLLCVLALTVTPYGGRLLGFTVHVLLDAKLGMTYIAEYAPLIGIPEKAILVFLLAFLVALVMLRPNYRLDEIGLLPVAVYGAFVHSRLLMLLVPVFAPLLAGLLARWVPDYDPAKDKHVLNAALITVAAFALVKLFPSQRKLESVVAEAFPQGAVEYLQHRPVQGKMYNHDFWGAYLIRSLGPEHKIFIDGRSQLFEDAGVLEDSLRIGYVDRETPRLLRKYRLDACLTYRWSALATYLSGSPDWEQVYQDNLAAIFVRKAAYDQ